MIELRYLFFTKCSLFFEKIIENNFKNLHKIISESKSPNNVYLNSKISPQNRF